MSVLVCVKCGGPVRVVGQTTRHYECQTCGQTDAKAPTIPKQTKSEADA